MPIIRTEREKWRAINDMYAKTVDRLTEARISKGWSRYWLAKQTGLTIPTITKFENNETRASFETILSISQALGYQLTIDIHNGSSAW